MKLNDLLENVTTAAITGHIRPDGDCVGSCMGLYNYLKENYSITVDVYLGDFAKPFRFMEGIDQVRGDDGAEKEYDLVFALDCGDKDRIGAGKECFDLAKRTVCIDHHINNVGYGDVNVIESNISATAELLYRLMEQEKISKNVAECLYTGIAHDTGVFQYTNVTPDTLRIAADLIEHEFDFSSILSKTFYEKTYHQKQILGRALANSTLFMEGKGIFSILHQDDMEFYGVKPVDLEGIVASLRNTTDVECAIFLYETNVSEYRVSLRSKSIVDVEKIASYFGGGGHIRAAGCTMNGTAQDVLNNISRLMEQQMNKQQTAPVKDCGENGDGRNS